MAATATDVREVEVPDERETHARQILVQAALLGILADTMLRHTPWGIGWTAWVLALSVATILLILRRGLRLSREQSAWLGAATICAAAFAWRDAEELQLLNFVATLAALAMFAMSLAGSPARSILAARIRDVLAAGAYSARDALGGALPLMRREAAIGPAIRGSAFGRLPLLRAALLTLPLVVVFASLLSRADPVFGSLFRFPGIDLGDVASHVLVAGAFAWTSAGWLRGALSNGDNRSAPSDRLPFTLGIVEVSAALGTLVGLFALFVGMQLRWLFGGADIVQATTGLSVAEYARRGFFELVSVAALVLPLILATRAGIVDDINAVRRHRKLSLCLIVLVGAIMASALLRMRLYVAHFGLTTDRLYASVFMAWLALVFFCLAITVLRGWSRPFATVTVLSGFAAVLALNAANPEVIVARVNLNRTSSALEVDYEYLARLSGDASGFVARSLASAEPSPATCHAARALRSRWLIRLANDTQASWGATRGGAAVLESLAPVAIQRLCGSFDAAPVSRSPSSGISRR